jgi:hypothetical protein
LLDFGAMMLDLRLTVEVSGTQASQFYGEDAIRRFVPKHGAPKHRIDLSWDSLAFQVSEKISDQMRAEVALAGFGILAEPTGIGIKSQSIKQVREVLQMWPRHGLQQAFQ